MSHALDCIICRAHLDSGGPAVCQLGDSSWGWVAFIEDWRGGPVDLIHPVCFAERYGIAKLVDVVHERDKIERSGRWT